MSSLTDQDLKKYSTKMDDINKKIKIAEDLIFVEDGSKNIIRPELNGYSLNYLINKLEKLYKIQDDIYIKIENKLT
jgi:hypothetical protein